MIAVGKQLSPEYPVHYKTTRIDNLDIFYREAGPQERL